MGKKMIIILAALVILAIVILFLKIMKGSNAAQAGASVKVGGNEYSVEIADTLASQAQGLSGRDRLAPKAGMLFDFGDSRVRTFWMQGMKFPIDIIWINSGAVIGFAQDAPAPTGGMPATFSSPGPADLVLELAAGSVAKDGIKVGDKVEIVRFTPTPTGENR